MAYSNDLRWRIVYAYVGQRKSVAAVARRFSVSSATVYRTVKRFYRYGDVRPGRIGRPDISRLLTRPQLYILVEYILRNPSAYLKEICAHLLTTTGSRYEAESIRRVIRGCGFTRKRVSELVNFNSIMRFRLDS